MKMIFWKALWSDKTFPNFITTLISTKRFLDAHSCEWHHRENRIDAIPFPENISLTDTHLGAHSCEWHHRQNLKDAIPFPMKTCHTHACTRSHTHTHTHTHTHPTLPLPRKRNKCKQKTCSKSSTEFPFIIKSNQMFSACQRLPQYKPRLSLSPQCVLPITWVHLLFLVNQITCSSCDISIFSWSDHAP